MKIGLVWFRNDLRVEDNTSLQRAISENDRVIAIYFFDPRHYDEDTYGFKKTGRYRTQFLIETVQQLSDNLNKLNISLLTFRQKPEDVFPQLSDQYEINIIYLQKEWTSEEKNVLKNVRKVTRPFDLKLVESYDQFLFHPEDIPFTIDKIPSVFTDFRKKCEKQISVRDSIEIQAMPSENLISHSTEIPSLHEFDFEPFSTHKYSAFPFEGGENEAKKRMRHYIWESKQISRYKKTRNGLLGEDYSSKFSPWLANGSISPRIIYHEIKKYEKEVEKNESTYWLVFELIWRDFFKYISLKHGDKIFSIGGILDKEYSWKTDMDLVSKWIHGRTDQPFVNANMIEFKKTGWMSNRGRQNVASYFAKELKLDWRIGAAYFESVLLDYDVHSNYGNWMYVAGVGNDPRDRKFNIERQAERYDPDEKFQQTWLENTLI